MSRSRSRSPPPHTSSRPRTRDWPTSWSTTNPAPSASTSHSHSQPWSDDPSAARSDYYDDLRSSWSRSYPDQQQHPHSHQSYTTSHSQGPSDGWSLRAPPASRATYDERPPYHSQQQSDRPRYAAGWDARSSLEHQQEQSRHWSASGGLPYDVDERAGRNDGGRWSGQGGQEEGHGRADDGPGWEGSGSSRGFDVSEGGRWTVGGQTSSSAVSGNGHQSSTGHRYHHHQQDEVPSHASRPPTTTAAGSSSHASSSHHHQNHRPPSEPSQHVIFLGLDPDMEEIDLFNFLKASVAEPESTTIIRDKVTGLSRGFGFALFRSLDDSTAFIAASHPHVAIPFGSTVPRRVKVDFASTTGGPAPSGVRSGAAPVIGGGGGGGVEANDGMRDIASGAASGGGRILLLRSVSPKTRWSDVRRVLEEVEATKGAVRRVVGVVGREKGGSGWGFGFVELRSAEAARTLLAYLMSPTAHPQGFTFPPSSTPISVTFASPLSFLPCSPSSSSTGVASVHTIPAGGPGGLGDLPQDVSVKYWDDRATLACEWVEGWREADKQAGELAAFLKTVEAGGLGGSGGGGPSGGQQGKKDESVGAGKGLLKRLEKDAMVPINIKLGGGGGKASAKADKAVKPVFGAAHDDSDDGAEGGEASTAAPAKGKLYKVPPMATSKKVATSISKWNTTQKELADAPTSADGPAFQPAATSANGALSHAHQPRGFTTAPKSTTAVTPTPPTSSTSTPAPAPPTADTDAEFEYSDVKKTACLLCQRQLKSLDLLRKHNAASELHKRNLQDTTLRQLAKERVAAVTAAQASEYRDRAAERRVAFNQPDKAPSSAASHGFGGGGGSTSTGPVKRKFVEGPSIDPPPAVPEPTLAPAEDASNVGNKLLAKMGWSQGQGLGLQGEGRVDPVQTQMLAARAGIGAVKPQQQQPSSGAGGWDSSYTQKVMDSARDRY